MATIERVYNQLEQNGWTKQELDDLDQRQVVRDFLQEGAIYGGANDTFGGKWAYRKIGIVFYPDKKNKPEVFEKSLTNAVCYVTGEGENEVVQDALTKTFLLAKGRMDSTNTFVKAEGTVREWANLNIINGRYDREWCSMLADELNKRGLVIVNRAYSQAKKDGGAFTAHINQPYFADTFKAE